MIPSVKVKIEADHCCNWRCCWGCKDQVLDAPRIERDESGSGSREVTVEKTTTVYHRHARSTSPPQHEMVAAALVDAVHVREKREEKKDE